MKKKLLALGIVTSIALTGCSAFQERTYIYKGVVRTESELEDILDATLEKENPNDDIEVNIYIEEDE